MLLGTGARLARLRLLRDRVAAGMSPRAHTATYLPTRRALALFRPWALALQFLTKECVTGLGNARLASLRRGSEPWCSNCEGSELGQALRWLVMQEVARTVTKSDSPTRNPVCSVHQTYPPTSERRTGPPSRCTWLPRTPPPCHHPRFSTILPGDRATRKKRQGYRDNVLRDTPIRRRCLTVRCRRTLWRNEEGYGREYSLRDRRYR